MTAPFTAADVRFDLRVDYAVRRISLGGEFDIAVASNLATAVAAMQRRTTGDITIDVKEVHFMDAAGLGAIAGASNAQAARGAAVVVTSANASVRKLFTLGRLVELLAVDDDAARN